MEQFISKVKLSLICKGRLLEEFSTLIEHVTFLISLLSIIDIYATKFHPFAILNEKYLCNWSSFFSHDFYVIFIIIEFKAFSNLEELYLSENKINDFVTTRGIIVCTNVCSWIKIKYFFCMVCQMKLSCQCFWDILFCPIDSNILTKLQHLDLSLNDFSARVLESLTAFPSLKILDLSYNNLMGSFTTKGKLYHWHQGDVVLHFYFLHWHNSKKAL